MCLYFLTVFENHTIGISIRYTLVYRNTLIPPKPSGHCLTLCLNCDQVQRYFPLPVERAEGAVSAAALLGPADAEEAPEVQPDGRRQVATA